VPTDGRISVKFIQNCVMQLCQTKITALINKIFINKKLQINLTQNELFIHTTNNNKQQHTC